MRNELQNPYVGVGIYSVPEASRLTGVSTYRIRRWLKGYSFKTTKEKREMAPVWRPIIPTIEGILALSFRDLMEIRYVDTFLQAGVNWKVIREASKYGQKELKVAHPFCTKKFKTDGRRIFSRVNEEFGDQKLLDILKNQFVWEQIIDKFLIELEFDENDEAIKWWPLGRENPVIIDPKRSFGQPIVVKEGVPTIVLYRAYLIEKSKLEVSKWYQVEESSIQAAIAFEERHAA